MRSERRKRLAKAHGPFASVYFDDTHDTPDAAEQLEAKWRDIRSSLEVEGASKDVIDTVENAILDRRPAVGRHGRAVIATNDQVLVNEPLIDPPQATVVRFSDYPYIGPLIQFEMPRQIYVLAAVDRCGADVTLYRGDAAESTRIDGDGFPVHKPASAGWNGYGDFQHTTEEAIRMNCRAVGDHLAQLVDEADPEVVFLCGEVRSRADLLAELPDRVKHRVAQLHAAAPKTAIDDEELRQLMTAEFDRRHCHEMTDIANRFEAEIGRGSGLAAQGIGPVCTALRNGNVDTLIVGELADATVVTGKALTTLAPDADTLSELGEPVERVVRADEALPFAAIAVGAALIPADDRITPADGIGALLRYAVTDRLVSQQF